MVNNKSKAKAKNASIPKRTAPSASEKKPTINVEVTKLCQDGVYTSIKDARGNILKFFVKLSNTIENVLDRIRGFERDFEYGKMSMYIGEIKLENYRTLSYYNIQPDSDLSIKEVLTIYVNDGDSKRIPLEVKPSDTVQSVINRLPNPRRFMGNRYEILNGGLRLEKEKTLANYAVEDGEQFETFKNIFGKTVAFKNSNCSAFNKVKNFDPLNEHFRYTVRTAYKKESILIEVFAGDIISVNFKLSDTIESIITRIKEDAGMKNQKLSLFHLYKKLDNDRTISDYHFEVDDTVYLSEFISIYVINMNSNEIPLRVIPSGTIKSVIDRVPNRGGGEHELVFNGRSLDGDSTLEDNNVEQGHVLEMRLKQVNVKDKTLSEKKLN